VLVHRLRESREKFGLSQQKFSQLCGFGINQVNRYESGTTDPTSEHLRIMAQKLSVSTDYLLGLTDDPQGIAAPGDTQPEERELLDMFRREGWAGVARLSVERITK
jgi:transcriptional regulator with XRE-family HTH domain